MMNADEQPPRLRGDRVLLLPVTDEHVGPLRAILATPQVRGRWGDEAASEHWPFDDPSATRFAIVTLDAATLTATSGIATRPGAVVGDDPGDRSPSTYTVIGMVQYGEEDEPSYRHASIDIFLDPALHGRGLGRDAVRTLAGYLIRDRGHHRLVIDPAADNEAAIRCYSSVGFRPVGIMRCYERDVDADTWHDGLLMDLLAEEFENSSVTAVRSAESASTDGIS